MTTKPITIVTKPTTILIANTVLHTDGIARLRNYYTKRFGTDSKYQNPLCDLLPHDYNDVPLFEKDDPNLRRLSDVEVLPEIAGRACYNSWNMLDASGRKTNREYLNNALHKGGHKSISYHSHFTIFIDGVSRGVSHELIRHYVGCVRDTDGAPSQESTRYCVHDGRMVLTPALLIEADRITDGNRIWVHDRRALESLAETYKIFDQILHWKHAVQYAYDRYQNFLTNCNVDNKKGLARKRVYESARDLLPTCAATQIIWTSNPEAMSKMIIERSAEGAHAEYRRLAVQLAQLVTAEFNNVFNETTHKIANIDLEDDFVSIA